MGFLFRTLYRNVFMYGKPLHQMLIGIVLLPVGIIVCWEALYGDPDYTYPYYAIFGAIFAIFALFLIGRGIKRQLMLRSRSTQ